MEANCAKSAGDHQTFGLGWAGAMELIGRKFAAAADRIDELEAGAGLSFGQEGALTQIQRAKDALMQIEPVSSQLKHWENAMASLNDARNCLKHTVPK